MDWEMIGSLLICYLMIAYGIGLRCYLEGASSAGRIKCDQGLFRQILKCFYEDLMLHCPWSREKSIRHRMKNLVKLAHERPEWKFDNPKGIWTCMELQKADESALRIAADGCFVSRTQFWITHLLGPPLFIPFWVVIIVVGLIISPFAYIGSLFGWCSKPFSDT